MKVAKSGDRAAGGENKFAKGCNYLGNYAVIGVVSIFRIKDTNETTKDYKAANQQRDNLFG